MNKTTGDEVADDNFWTWLGRYVGYRSSDCLFGSDGRQMGYFAEGDEVYGCNGKYIGEVRSGNRLIKNLRKIAWTRKRLTPSMLKTSPGHRDVGAKEMMAGFEDFRIPLEGV